MLQIVTKSAAETFGFGSKLARLLKPGDVICLTGTLGAGKTALVQGITAGLGTSDPAISPTFTIMNVYDGHPPVYHFDLYRLESAEQLYDLGFDEYTAAGGISLIEWADKFKDDMPSKCLWIEIMPQGDTLRMISVTAYGDRYQQIVGELK